MDIPTTPQTKRHDRQTGLSLLLGITIWFLYQNTAYALASLSCQGGWLSVNSAGISGLQWVETLLSVVALLLMLVLIYVPWRKWRQYQSEKRADNPRMLQETEADRRPLIAFVTMLLNGLFGLFIIASFVPLFALNACGQG